MFLYYFLLFCLCSPRFRPSSYHEELKILFLNYAAESDSGFNLILIDPPWENSSAHQKSKYV